jgi:hypothetical protein
MLGETCRRVCYALVMRTQVLPRLNPAERNVMEELSKGESLNRKQATQLEVVLGRGEGKSTWEIEGVFRIGPVSISVRVPRLNERGVVGLLKEANHKPGKAALVLTPVNRVLKFVQTERAKDATH